MKSLGVVALALLCIALFAFAVKNVLTTSREWEMFEQDTARLFTAIEVERIVRDSTAPILARLDSAAAVGLRVANRNRRLGDSLEAVSDSLTALLPALQTPRESLQVTARALEVARGSLRGLKVSNDSLRGVIRVRDSQSLLLRAESKRAWGLVDSASRVIRSTPTCPRIPLLGIPLPQVGIGAALTPRGIQPAVAVVVPLGRC